MPGHRQPCVLVPIGGLQAQINAPRAGQRPQAFGGGLCQRAQVKAGGLEHGGIGAGQRQHLVGLANGVIQLLRHGAQGLVFALRVRFAQGKRHLCGQSSQGRTQLVRSVVDKAAARFQSVAVAPRVQVQSVDQRLHVGGYLVGAHRGEVVGPARRNAGAQPLQGAQSQLHRHHHQRQCGQQQEEVAGNRVEHQRAGEILAAFQCLGHLNDDP